jgi:hypothetical protein
MKHALGILGTLCLIGGLGSCVLGGGTLAGNVLNAAIGVALFALGVVAIGFGAVLGELEKIRDALRPTPTLTDRQPPASRRDPETVADRWNK